jgi:hypothetical protein
MLRDIFTNAKQTLREFKDNNVADIDTKIDEPCDRMTALLSNWGKVFETFYIKDPSEADKDAAANHYD